MRLVFLNIVLALCCCNFSTAQLDEILKKAGESISHTNAAGLSDDKIVAGLKQALQVSTSKEAGRLSEKRGHQDSATSQTSDRRPGDANVGYGRESGRT